MKIALLFTTVVVSLPVALMVGSDPVPTETNLLDKDYHCGLIQKKLREARQDQKETLQLQYKQCLDLFDSMVFRYTKDKADSAGMGVRDWLKRNAEVDHKLNPPCYFLSLKDRKGSGLIYVPPAMTQEYKLPPPPKSEITKNDLARKDDECDVIYDENIDLFKKPIAQLVKEEAAKRFKACMEELEDMTVQYVRQRARAERIPNVKDWLEKSKDAMVDEEYQGGPCYLLNIYGSDNKLHKVYLPRDDPAFQPPKKTEDQIPPYQVGPTGRIRLTRFKEPVFDPWAPQNYPKNCRQQSWTGHTEADLAAKAIECDDLHKQTQGYFGGAGSEDTENKALKAYKDCKESLDTRAENYVSERACLAKKKCNMEWLMEKQADPQSNIKLRDFDRDVKMFVIEARGRRSRTFVPLPIDKYKVFVPETPAKKPQTTTPVNEIPKKTGNVFDDAIVKHRRIISGLDPETGLPRPGQEDSEEKKTD